MKIVTTLCAMMIVAALISSGCKHTPQYDCTGYTPTYYPVPGDTNNVSVKALLDNSCAIEGCHGANGDGGLNLSTYEGASAASKEKRFMGAIQHKPFYQAMPKNAAILPDQDIHKLFCWIENGSPQ